WPMYCPTRSSRVTVTTVFLRTHPNRCRMSAMRTATVVLPVPGLPVKHICMLGCSDSIPTCARALATSRNAAISRTRCLTGARPMRSLSRSEEHTSELQSRENLVCRLLLEKKKKQNDQRNDATEQIEERMHARVG